MLIGSTYVVLGGAVGLGLAAARRLLDLGAELVLVDRAAIPDDLPDRRATLVRADPADAGAAERIIARLLADHPRISGIITTGELGRAADPVFGLVRGLVPALLREVSASGVADVIVLGAAPHEEPSTLVSGARATAAWAAAARACTAQLRAELGPRGIRTVHLAAGHWRSGIAAEAAPLPRASFDPEDLAQLVSFLLQQPADVAIDELALVPTAHAWD
ncbi:KR domain-containing protein [Leucobacter triazinivorans]|uniref:SDR family oxidoreductase n=1 Tax=Leucobacter triazinivorans TaxID=1784719 RepID=A0A4P6KHM1_9MICO|nr:KR domain-containing protein [Leucobacter triazinivorans]QBE49976.1 hypothetical protein EVS81_15010 [Leucobacter triazinivorans]